MNHFAECCRTKNSKTTAKAKHVTKVHSVDAAQTTDSDEEDKEQSRCYVISNSNKRLPLEDTVTLKLTNGDAIRFQVDTGSDVNVLPLNIYKAATGDEQLANVRPPTLSNLTAYTGDKVVGQVQLKVTRFDKRSKILLHLVDDRVRPILGKRDCVALNIVKRLDTDQHRVPACGRVHTVISESLTLDDIFVQF
jgi:hypothetical protein